MAGDGEENTSRGDSAYETGSEAENRVFGGWPRVNTVEAVQKEEGEMGYLRDDSEDDSGYNSGYEAENEDDESETESEWWEGLSWWRKLFHALAGIVKVCGDLYLDDVYDQA